MRSNRTFIFITILIGLILQIIPMPAEADVYRPDWLLMILCYWAMALPNRVSIGIAGLTGVVLDLLYGTALGVHSFALAVPIFLVAANYQRMRNQSILQLAVTIGVLSMIYHLLIYWLQFWLTSIDFRLTFLWPSVTSIFLWPWLFWLLRKFRRKLGVS
ncbi:rod shape-determining protein MreD [Glaciecola sp. XM2]|jgi:rod shape-determining protein MreD|uniref:rod shape-determining protein MreD n=1 Tax=Glaciecola sp. XM2 TaxID=1914931 RepID=UPI001BDEDD9E|nr:rod shape-determining protein MreD [Glaciecola sp. XM2]MBT1451679.1 rod shape-determining protein MreD [Glaciecola sp. XM2]